jgi:hypothetical protein
MKNRLTFEDLKKASLNEKFVLLNPKAGFFLSYEGNPICISISEKFCPKDSCIRVTTPTNNALEQILTEHLFRELNLIILKRTKLTKVLYEK